jgi:cob(I)alamin adenosyltransferase
MSYLTTRKGDNGTTCIGGGRVPKTHPLIRLVGILDTVQSQVGLLDNYSAKYPYLKKPIEQICNDLYTIMGKVHKGCPDYLSREEMQPFVDNLDSIIASIEVPKMNQFIRPTARFSIANNARAMCRLYENMVLHIEEELDGERSISQYLNRLSSVIYGFMIYINSHEEEIKPVVEFKLAFTTLGLFLGLIISIALIMYIMI